MVLRAGEGMEMPTVVLLLHACTRCDLTHSKTKSPKQTGWKMHGDVFI